MLIEKNKLLYRINFIVFNFTYWLILNRKTKIENFKLRNLIQIVIYSSIIPTYIYRITQYIKHLPLQSNFITRANLFTRFNDSYYYQFIYQTIIKTKIFLKRFYWKSIYIRSSTNISTILNYSKTIDQSKSKTKTDPKWFFETKFETKIHPFRIQRDLKTPIIYNTYQNKNDRSIKVDQAKIIVRNDPKQILRTDLRRSTTVGREQDVARAKSIHCQRLAKNAAVKSE